VVDTEGAAPDVHGLKESWLEANQLGHPPRVRVLGERKKWKVTQKRPGGCRVGCVGCVGWGKRGPFWGERGGVTRGEWEEDSE